MNPFLFKDMGCQGNDGDGFRIVSGFYFFYGSQAVHYGHPDIHEHEIRFMAGKQFKGRLSVYSRVDPKSNG